MKKTLDQLLEKLIEKKLSTESIFPIDSPASGKKLLTVPLPGKNEVYKQQDIQDEDNLDEQRTANQSTGFDEDTDAESDSMNNAENLKSFNASKMYVEGKLSDKELVKYIIRENKEVLNEIDLAKIAKFTMAFLRGLKILRRVSKASNPIVAIGLECVSYACRKALVPKVVKGLKYSTMAMSDPIQRAQIHTIIDILAKAV